MSFSKYYCLGCERPNNCNCGTTDKHFVFSDKLRPPLNTKNKVRWRMFLYHCPQFGNCVPEHLYDEFKTFLKKLGHSGLLNGRNWNA